MTVRELAEKLLAVPEEEKDLSIFYDSPNADIEVTALERERYPFKVIWVLS